MGSREREMNSPGPARCFVHVMNAYFSNLMWLLPLLGVFWLAACGAPTTPPSVTVAAPVGAQSPATAEVKHGSEPTGAVTKERVAPAAPLTEEIQAPALTPSTTATSPAPEPATPKPAVPPNPEPTLPPAPGQELVLDPVTPTPVFPAGQVGPISEDQLKQELRGARFSTGGWKTNFRLRSVHYTEITGGGPGKDDIPPIDQPKFETVSEANEWLVDREPVQVVNIDGDARAYPIQIMIWHEVVNDTVGGEPVVVTY